MDSHEYANKIKKVAEELLKREAFPIPSYDSGDVYLSYYSDKEPFIAGVKALGSGKKDLTSPDYVVFRPAFGGLRMSVSKDAVCRKVREAQYECEPLLSELDNQVIEAAEAAPEAGSQF